MLDLGKILRVYSRIHIGGLKVVTHLLHERQHRSQSVVHVVRHTARKLSHRVLALGGQHAGARPFRPLQILYGDRCLRTELLDELRIIRGQTPGRARRDLDHPDETVPRDQRCAQHALFPEVLGGTPTSVVVVEQSRELDHRFIRPFAPGLTLSIEAIHAARLENAPEIRRHRDP